MKCHRILHGVFVLFFFYQVHWVDFTENASFKSSGVICRPRLSFSLPDEFSVDRKDSEGFFSTSLTSGRVGLAIAPITRLTGH